MDINWNKVRDSLTDALMEDLRELVDGAEEDIRAYSGTLAKAIGEAIRTDNRTLVKSVKGQLGLLAQLNALRVRDAAIAGLERVIDVAFRVGLAVLTAV